MTAASQRYDHPAAKDDASDADILRAQAIWGSVLVRARIDADGIVRYSIVCEDDQCGGKCKGTK